MTKKFLLELYYKLIFPRIIEEKMLLLLRKGKISKWFSGIGQEAISVGATMALNDEDTIFPMHRNLGVFTSRDINLKSLFCSSKVNFDVLLLIIVCNFNFFIVYFFIF